MLPLLTEAFKKGRKEEFDALVAKALGILSFFGAGIAFFLFAAASPVVAFIANAEYLGAGPSGWSSPDAMRVVAFVFLFFFLSSLSTYLLIAAGKQAELLKINAKIALFNLVGNALVIPFFSFVGSAFVTLVSQILLLVVTARTAKIHTGASVAAASRPLAANAALGILASALAVWVTSEFAFGTFASLAVVTGIFAVTYGVP